MVGKDIFRPSAHEFEAHRRNEYLANCIAEMKSKRMALIRAIHESHSREEEKELAYWLLGECRSVAQNIISSCVFLKCLPSQQLQEINHFIRTISLFETRFLDQQAKDLYLQAKNILTETMNNLDNYLDETD